MTTSEALSPELLQLLHDSESCELVAYPDPGTGGEPWTIGWGATFYEDGRPVGQHDRISQSRADQLLEFHVQRAAAEVSRLVTVPLTPPMRWALTSFQYNTGALSKSTLLKKLNTGDYEGAAREFPRWVNGANGPLPGLQVRRKREMDLFLSQGLPGGGTAAPSGSFIITAIQGTFLKKHPLDSSQLGEASLHQVRKNRSYLVSRILGELQGHLQVELSHGAGTWWVYTPHWQGFAPTLINESTGRPIGKPQVPQQTPPSDILLKVPYYSQRDNYTQASRTCFSSSCAMLLKFLRPGAIKGDDDYIRVVLSIGDTIYPQTHIRALAHYGLKARFLSTADWRDIDQELEAGRPVAAGFLHKGPVYDPVGGGHWLTIIGRTDAGRRYIVHDPWGDLDLVSGYYISTKGASLHYSKKNWGPRWLIHGPNSGYLLTARA